jgi:multiple sugar transport system substrate-binding protein
MNVKKVILLVLLVAVAVTGIFIAVNKTKSQADKSADKGPVNIKVAAWDVSTTKYFSELIAAFDASQPNVTVEVFDIPAADYTQKLSVMLNGGSEVDAFWIKDGDTTKGLANRNQLADLSAYVRRDNINLALFNGLAEGFNMDGKLTAMPAHTAYYVLFYNKDIFDKAGVPYPSNDLTWSQWEQLANRLTSGSGDNKVWGAHLHTWQALVQNWAVQDGKHTIVDTDYLFMKPYYEMAVRMQDAGSIMDFGSLKAGNINYTNACLRGNVAMIPMGFWLANGIKDRIDRGEVKMNWGVATIPHPDGTPAGWTVGSVTPIAVNQGSNNKDTSWEFVKFVTSDAGAKIYASYVTFPSRASTENLKDIANIPGMPEGLLEALAVKNIALDRPMVDYVAEVNQMLGEEHSLIMLKEVSIDQGIAKMAQRSKEIQGK